jgi:putative transposase
VAQLFAAHHGRYGSPRITAELREARWRVSENTVTELMREHGLQARPPRCRRHTTRPGRGRWRAPDLVGRRFAADGLNRRWYGDGTEIATDEGKLFLASVLDMGSRRIVGFALSEHHDAELAYAAGDGDRGPRWPGGDRRRGAAHRPGQRTQARSFRAACQRCGITARRPSTTAEARCHGRPQAVTQ